MSGTDVLTYEELCARLKEMDALVASIRDEEVDAIVGKNKVVLLDSACKFEEALRASREKFRAIYDALSIAIALFDTDGKALNVNKSCLALFGARDIMDILDFDLMSLKRIPEEYFNNIFSGKTVNYQRRLDFAEAASRGLKNCKTTGVLHLDVCISPMLRSDEHTVSGYLMKLSDITTHKLSEMKVAFQGKLLESVGEAVVATDTGDRIIYWGRGAEKMFGSAEQEMLGRQVGDLFYKEGVFEDMVVLEDKAVFAEYSKIRADGSELWLGTTLSLIKNSEGNVEGVVGILRDITRRKQAEDALKHRENQLETLYRRLLLTQEEERKRLSRELHDSIGQKIISIQLEIEWLKSRDPDASDKEVYVNMTRQTIDAVEELQRICKGLRPLVIDKVGFNAAIKSLLDEFEANSDIQITSRILQIDETHITPDTAINIYRILQEAMSNIVRHSKTKKAFVSLQVEGAEIALDVSDEGCGLGNMASKKLSFGLLGMRERANMSGGQFVIDSAPGKGTRVKVTIPVEAAMRMTET